MQKLLFIHLFLFTLFSVTAQDLITAKEQKRLGIEYLSQGKTDSALIFLHEAESLGLLDGELMGSLALAHLQNEEVSKAIKWAKLSLTDKVNPSPDGWLAGALAYEKQGRMKKRDSWLKKGIQKFPTDYLLRYYSAKAAFPTDPQKAESDLLTAIFLEPVYAPSHLLLGQEMYRKGENTKTLLPFLYYLMLYHDAPESPDIVALIENLLNDWASMPASTTKVKYQKEDALLPSFKPTPRDPSTEKDEWLVQQLSQLMKSMEEEDFINQNPSWAYYIDFFSNASKQDHSEALIYHLIFSRYKPETLEWITKYQNKYEMMTLWVSIWEFGR